MPQDWRRGRFILAKLDLVMSFWDEQFERVVFTVVLIIVVELLAQVMHMHAHRGIFRGIKIRALIEHLLRHGHLFWCEAVKSDRHQIAQEILIQLLAVKGVTRQNFLKLFYFLFGCSQLNSL